ncbi:MAG: hypothetical protein ACLQVY_02750 [Limisphaerales bacterium]
MPNDLVDSMPRPFVFPGDAFAFANQTYWEYHFGPNGKTTFRPRPTKPDYGHRCFVLTRAARLFLFHSRFDPAQPALNDEGCRRRVREVLSRRVHQTCAPEHRVTIPGFANLRQFSAAKEKLLKAECGGAWRSYVLRSHWRMVFPISRAHQARTAASLRAALQRGFSPVVHLVKFPALTINHSMLFFDAEETAQGIEFQAYDPNNAAQPEKIHFDAARKTFRLPPNPYFAGGDLDIIEIFRNWLM